MAEVPDAPADKADDSKAEKRPAEEVENKEEAPKKSPKVRASTPPTPDAPSAAPSDACARFPGQVAEPEGEQKKTEEAPADAADKKETVEPSPLLPDPTSAAGKDGLRPG